MKITSLVKINSNTHVSEYSSQSSSNASDCLQTMITSCFSHIGSLFSCLQPRQPLVNRTTATQSAQTVLESQKKGKERARIPDFCQKQREVLLKKVTANPEIYSQLCDLFDGMQIIQKLGSGTFGDVMDVLLRPNSTLDLKGNFALKLISLEEALSPDSSISFLITKDRIGGEGLALMLEPSDFLIKTTHVITLSSKGQVLVHKSIDPSALNGHVIIGILSKSFPSEELFDLISENEPSLAFIRKIGFQVANALENLHKHKLIHRDVKPENVLVDESGNAKLIDYGFLRMISSQNKAATYCGTAGYVAPEIVLQNTYDEKVDSFSFGMLLFATYSGSRPWMGSTEEINLEDTKRYGEDPAMSIDQISLEFRDLQNVAQAKGLQDVLDLLDLIQKLTYADPKRRLSMKEALTHPFFQG